MTSQPNNTEALVCTLPAMNAGVDREQRQVREAILRHIARYRLSTFGVIQKLSECRELDGAELRRVLKELVQFELLVTASLYRGLSYWALAPAAAEFCGLTLDRAGFLSEPAKRHAYAMLLFCHQSESVRKRLIRDDFQSTILSSVLRPGMPPTYYVAPRPNGRLGLARIDVGRTGRWDRILQTVWNDCEQHGNLSVWQPFVAADRFEITVLTALPQKAERLQEALQEVSASFRIPLHVVALPDMIPLLPGVKTLKSFL